MYLVNYRPKMQLCTVLWVPWVQWKWQTLHVFSRRHGGRRCWMRTATTVITVTVQKWLGCHQVFISVHRSRLCEKSFSSWDSRACGGRRHSAAFPCITLQWKHQGQSTVWLALRASWDFQHGGGERMVLLSPPHCHIYDTNNTPRSVNENWPIPNPHLLDVSYLEHIFWVQQIQASDLTVISLMFSYFHLHHQEGQKKKKRDAQFHEERCHSPPGAHGKYYGEENFYIICMLIKCILLFSTEVLGIQQREWTFLICLCQSTMAENTRNGYQKSHRERKFKCVPNRITALQHRAAPLCMHSSVHTSWKTRRDLQCNVGCVTVTAWYITTRCKIKVSLSWSILHSTICASFS